VVVVGDSRLTGRVIASNWEEEDNGGKKGELPCQT